MNDSIREVLMKCWDPIQVQDEPGASDEYDSYIDGVFRLLARGATDSEVAEHLATIERDSMGYSTQAEALLPVARRLKQLVVRGPA